MPPYVLALFPATVTWMNSAAAASLPKPPPSGALLPVTVTFMSDTEPPVWKIPPPMEPAAFPEIVLLVMVRLPPRA